MKISKIKISKFHQFEDFELDLTYPKGHEKEGKPLDKVCFIGQSGTGKTTLLEMIIEASQASRKLSIKNKRSDTDEAIFELKDKDAKSYFFLLNIRSPTNSFNFNKSFSPKMLYFPSGIAGYNFLAKGSYITASATEKNFDISDPNLYMFDALNLQNVWSKFRNSLIIYQNKLTNIRLNLAIEIEKGKENIDLKKEVENWKSKNFNPVEIAAKECLDPVLKHLFLQVKKDIDDINQVNSINVCTLIGGEVIPYEHLSTGTKQIIFTAFPIYQLLEDESIVLMDEPETSLYPDIQREIIPYYTSFDKNKTSQFFFATHSPIIASAFEPWEIVELKFDEKGKVYREKYYEGENHVDNYRLDPQILRYDQILTRIFDLSGDSDAKRAEKLQELAILKNQVEKLKKEEMENPNPETQEIIKKYLQLSDDISGTWALSRHEKN